MYALNHLKNKYLLCIKELRNKGKYPKDTKFPEFGGIYTIRKVFYLNGKLAYYLNEVKNNGGKEKEIAFSEDFFVIISDSLVKESNREVKRLIFESLNRTSLDV